MYDFGESNSPPGLAHSFKVGLHLLNSAVTFPVFELLGIMPYFNELNYSELYGRRL